MKFVEFDVEQESWITRERDPDDMWDRDSTDGSVNVRDAKLVNEQTWDSLPVPDSVTHGDTIYLVWAMYGTGDSFGSDGGNYELLEVCTTKEAADERKLHYETVKDFSVPWNGYFEWLQFLDIEEFVL